MSRDRLAAMRAQRQPQAGAPVHENHEMSNLTNGNSHNVDITTTGGFLQEVESIQAGINQYNTNVNQIASLHARMMSSLNDGRNHDSAQLDQLTADTRSLGQDLKRRIETLKHGPMSPDTAIRRNGISVTGQKLLEAVQNYQRVESDHRGKEEDRVKRQLLIVKPDARPEEIKAVVEGGGQQIFAQALTSSDQYGAARGALREVEDRQNDLRKMEATMADLAQLFNDMSILVNQQDETINAIEDTAKNVEYDTEQGKVQTDKAVVSARNARRGRIICFWITFTIIAILAIALGVYFGVPGIGWHARNKN